MSKNRNVEKYWFPRAFLSDRGASDYVRFNILLTFNNDSKHDFSFSIGGETQKFVFSGIPRQRVTQ